LPPNREGAQRRTMPLVRYLSGFPPPERDVGMRFVLTYEGQLPSEQHCSAATKHGIRKQFHPQLKELWEIEPTLKAWETGGLGIIDGFEVPGPPKVRLGGFEFRPLVTGELNLVCGLGIVFLRPENPGRIVKPGGDI